MAPNNTTEASGITFTGNEMKLLAYAWQCMEGDPKIDYDKLAPMAGYTVGSAKVTLGKLKRKMKDHAAASGGAATTGKPASNPSTPKSASKTPKRKNVGASEDGVGAGGAVEESPTKKSKKSAVKKGGKKGAKNEDDDDEYEKVTIVKRETDGLMADAASYLDGGNTGFGGFDGVFDTTTVSFDLGGYGPVGEQV